MRHTDTLLIWLPYAVFVVLATAYAIFVLSWVGISKTDEPIVSVGVRSESTEDAACSITTRGA